jgi:hypothetical protein
MQEQKTANQELERLSIRNLAREKPSPEVLDPVG